ncbi:hypothetical protein EXIGLDRAFT_757688 [Exidia glandulosa HHB12029]|uniref:Mug135-like C-terminal domain-containing protein n=1 Tax=Exidia glandulosa HHB12029 TaxID=1314781 RepID=A0A165Z189_EXIGL|nr:hypothetical protein EXIGLDRAFT_757688 [Exidia glandulosa HHB12029]
MALIAPRNAAGIPVPAQAQGPPTESDVGAGFDYLQRLYLHTSKDLQLASRPTNAEIGAAHVHVAALTAAHAPEEAAPAWFIAGLTAALAPIKADVAEIKRDQADIKRDQAATTKDLKVVKRALKALERDNSIMRNTQRGEGIVRPFDIVKTPGPLNPEADDVNDGDYYQDPTQAPWSLPALRDIHAIRALNGTQADRYIEAYKLTPDNRASLDKKRVTIALSIGCNVHLYTS